MKIISLMGESNSGKTSIISLLIEELISKGFEPINNIENVFSYRKTKERTIAFKYRKKVLLVTTIGDSAKLIKGELNKAKKIYNLKDEDIHMFICACHNGKSKQFLMKLSTISIFIPKIYSFKINYLNIITDKIIMEYIYDTIMANY